MSGDRVNMKVLLRALAKKNVDILREVAIIKSGYTGMITVEINCNEGNVTDVKIKPEIHA
jgi:DNA-binding protein YbaB